MTTSQNHKQTNVGKGAVKYLKPLYTADGNVNGTVCNDIMLSKKKPETKDKYCMAPLMRSLE